MTTIYSLILSRNIFLRAHTHEFHMNMASGTHGVQASQKHQVQASETQLRGKSCKQVRHMSTCPSPQPCTTCAIPRMLLAQREQKL
jgi:hypothetical protein